MFNKLPNWLKKMFFITLAIMFVCILSTAFFMPKVWLNEEEYLNNYAKEKKLQNEVDNLNLQYYASILENGVFQIKDSQGKNIGYNVVYNKIKTFYKYRIYVNGKLLQEESMVSNSPQLEVLVEEYFDEASAKIIPIEILHKFSYLRTLGKGNELMKPDNFVDISGGGDFISDTQLGVYNTVLRFTFDNIGDAGTQVVFTIKDNTLKNNLGLIFSMFEVRRTI